MGADRTIARALYEALRIPGAPGNPGGDETINVNSTDYIFSFDELCWLLDHMVVPGEPRKAYEQLRVEQAGGPEKYDTLKIDRSLYRFCWDDFRWLHEAYSSREKQARTKPAPAGGGPPTGDAAKPGATGERSAPPPAGPEAGEKPKS